MEEEATADSVASNWTIPEVSAESEFVDSVASKDVTIDADSGVWVRMFLPKSALLSKKRISIIVHVHGGGFINFSPATVTYHDFCKTVARESNAFVISLSHRLAPMHRLPAQYEDLVATLKWLQSLKFSDSSTSFHEKMISEEKKKEEWLKSYADFADIFLMGGSSGGNIIYNALLQSPHHLSLKGLILIQPFFGGILRTDSEILLKDAPILSLATSDYLWSLALPEGADRDHPYCNPTMTKSLLKESDNIPRSLILVGGLDLLRTRQIQFAELLENSGKEVKLVQYPNALHGFVDVATNSVSYLFMPDILSFLTDSSHHTIC